MRPGVHLLSQNCAHGNSGHVPGENLGRVKRFTPGIAQDVFIDAIGV